MKKIFNYKAKNISRLLNAIICSVIIFISISTVAYGQRNYLFENISIPEGLSNTEVHSIFQDSNGFLWISTADGLNRYDGFTMKVFKSDPNDLSTLPSNNCFAMAEDDEGYIWVGVYGNIIAKYDPKNESFEPFPIDIGSENNISDFQTALFDSKGNLWFGTTVHGMQKYNRSTNAFEQIAFDTTNNNVPWGQITMVKELKNGNLLVADYANGIKIYNEQLKLFQSYYLKTNYSPDMINIIYEDYSGSIWFGGRNQLLKYSPSYYSTEDYDIFEYFDSPTNYDDVTGIVQDNEGYMWAGVYAQGLYRIDPSSKEIRRIDYNRLNYNFTRYERATIWQIFKDIYNVVWIGTWERGLIKFDPFREPFNYVQFKTNDLFSSSANIANVISGSQQNKMITIGTSTKGLFTYNLETRESSNLKFPANKSTLFGDDINIQTLVVDNDGNKWFSYNGLGIHKLDTNNLLSFYSSPQIGKTVNYAINTMKIDLSNNIWFASEYGYEAFNPHTNQFSLLPTVMTKKMSDNLKAEVTKIPQSRKPIASILKAGEAINYEKVFTVDKDQKVLIIGVGEGRMVQGNEGLFDKGALRTNDGELIWSMNDLAKTFNDGGGFKNRISIKCIELKKGDYKITFATDVGHSFGLWNVIPPVDSLWYGIQILELNDTEFNTIKRLNEKEVNSDQFIPMEIGTSIEMSKRLYNVLWLGSAFNSFFKYDLTTNQYTQYNFDSINRFSPNNAISYLFEDREGIVWIATQNNLLRFDPVTEEIEKYGQEDGLPSNLVNSIIEDVQGNLWINTSGGLSKLNKYAPKDKWNFVNFDTRDGLKGFSSSKASWISGEGEIVIGSNDGISSFFPGKINEVKPNIVIQDIKVSDVSLKSSLSEISIDESIQNLEKISLSYTQNNLSFDFASIHFSRPEKNKILYKLEGFNDEWISSNRNFVSFTNLNPGKYTFSVKGSNGDGIWDDVGKSIRIIIAPPWWRTNWAYGFYILLLALSVFGSDKFFRARLIKKERDRNQVRELEHAKEIEKAYNDLKSTQSQLIQSEKMASLGELTAGIAHEIQNPLNFVNNFSEVNTELIEELQEKRKNGNNDFDDEDEIINDIKENEVKITHHGKRADAIVKGMLQHSRSSSDVKEPTDINALADEYLRLSYHGLRATDKSFNADFKEDFDKQLPKVNVIPQDIGRVILNLINNAFYAVDKKRRQSPDDYKPIVCVSTRKIDDRIEIQVQDNGDGIPDSIKKKIFQPFFTTKPSGEGTGLGLSLSFEIVTKGHGGKLTVESSKVDGTIFTIYLPLNKENEDISSRR